MTSRSSDEQRLTFLGALKQMGPLWIFPFLFAGSLLYTKAPWFVILFMFLFSVLLMVAMRYPEYRPIGTRTEKVRRTAVQRNHELSTCLGSLISAVNNIALTTDDERTRRELENAVRPAQEVLNNPPEMH
jgi:hypothetical protein